jgi:hypothetical protein
LQATFNGCEIINRKRIGERLDHTEIGASLFSLQDARLLAGHPMARQIKKPNKDERRWEALE